MMRTYFDYGDFENSILYLLGGVELVFVAAGMAIISRRISDRCEPCDCFMNETEGFSLT